VSFFVNLIFGIDFKQSQDLTLVQIGNPLGQRLVAPDRQNPCVIRLIGALGKRQIHTTPFLHRNKSRLAAAYLFQAGGPAVDHIQPAFESKEFLGDRHADLIEGIDRGMLLRQVEEGGKRLLLQPFKVVAPVTLFLLSDPFQDVRHQKL